MPQNKDLKRLVRQRMAETGERYTVARASIVGPPGLDEDLDRRRRLAAQVQQFAHKHERLDALRELQGAVTATEMRAMGPLPDDTIDALITGLGDPHPQVRYWCAAVLDHATNERAVLAVVPLLDDPVDRVRRMAVHALGCVACKPAGSAELPDDLMERLAGMAETDPNAKVRREAHFTLACRRGQVPRRKPRPR